MNNQKESKYKYWDEKSTEEKIESLRLEVKSLERSVKELVDTVWELRNHKHNENGEAVSITRLAE